jgi:hypothetical protein
MNKILVSPWWRKVNRPRYYVSDGRAPLGTVYESKGVFAAIDPDGILVAASTNFQNAVSALVTATGGSS